MANGRRDHARIVRGNTVVEAAGQQELHQPDEIGIHIGFPRKSNFLRFLVRALA